VSPHGIANGEASSLDGVGSEIQNGFREYRAGGISFAALLDRIFPLIYPRLAAFFGGVYRLQPADQDDLIQTIMLKFLKSENSCRQYDPDRPFLPWIFTIARNEAKNFLKSRRRNEEVFVPRDSTNGNDDLVGRGICLQRSISIEDRVYFDELLGFCPKTMELLWLKYCEGFKDEELAEYFQEPLSKIKARLRKVIKILRKLLSQMGEQCHVE